jgi:hypothetical protein
VGWPCKKVERNGINRMSCHQFISSFDILVFFVARHNGPSQQRSNSATVQVSNGPIQQRSESATVQVSNGPIQPSMAYNHTTGSTRWQKLLVHAKSLRQGGTHLASYASQSSKFNKTRPFFENYSGDDASSLHPGFQDTSVDLQDHIVRRTVHSLLRV